MVGPALIAASDNYRLNRERVNALFSEAVHSPITHVIGGPGYGKSSAVYDFLKRRDADTIWVQFSDADNSISRAWETITHACASINKEFAGELRKLGFPIAASHSKRLMDIYYDYVEPKQEYFLVFDDLHLITNRNVLWLLRTVTEECLENLHIIATSRVKPVMPAGSLLAEDSIHFVIDENQLAFTRNETAEYLHGAGVDVTPDVVDAIYEASEGWPLFLGLAAAMLAHSKTSPEYLITSIRSNILGTIRDEYFPSIPETLQKFILSVSLIAYPAQELVRELPNGERMEEILRRYTSLIRFDSFSHVYHVHQLFLEYLQGQQDRLTDEEQSAVFRAAANWCRDNGHTSDTLVYLEKLGDYPAILAFVYSMPSAIPPDSASVILRILDNAPASVYDQIPTAHAIHSRLLYCLGRYTEAIDELTHVIETYEARERTPFNLEVLLGAYNHLGLLRMLISTSTGQHDFAELFKNADEYANALGYSIHVPMDNVMLGTYVSRVGPQDPEGFERHVDALRRSTPHTANTMNGFMHGLYELAKSEFLYMRNELAEAERYAFIALAKARDRSQYEIENRSLLFLLRTACASGDYTRAKEVLCMLDRQVQDAKYFNARILHDIVTGWFYALIEQPDRAADWLKRDYNTLEASEIVVGVEDLIKCRFFLMQRRFHCCAAFIEGRSEECGMKTFLLGQVTFSTILAICCYNMGEKVKAFAYLKQAWGVAMPAGIVMPFIEMGNYMRTLTRAALLNKNTGIPETWLKDIHNKSSSFAKRAAYLRTEFAREHSEITSFHLTEKEMGILRDLSLGLSRSETATANNLSINTVKAMLRIIYDKLGAENSYDAIRVAASKGLLD